MMGRSRKLEREYHQVRRTRRWLRLRVNFGEFGFGAFLAGVLLCGGYLIIDGMRQVPVETESNEEKSQLAVAQERAEPREPETARPAPVDRFPPVTEGKPAEALVAGEAQQPRETGTPQRRPAGENPVEAPEAAPAVGISGTKALAAASPQPEAPATEPVVPAPVGADAPPELSVPPAGEARAPGNDTRILATGDPIAPAQSPSQQPPAPEAVAKAPSAALAQADSEWFWSGWFDDGERKTDGQATEPAPESTSRSSRVADAPPQRQPEPTQVAKAPPQPFWSGWFGGTGEAGGDGPAPAAAAQPSQPAEAEAMPEPEPSQVASAQAEPEARTSQVAQAEPEPFWSGWFGGTGEAGGDMPKPAPEAELEASKSVEAQAEPKTESSQVAKAEPEPFWSGWFDGADTGEQQALAADEPPADPGAPAQTAASAEKPVAPHPDDGAFWKLFSDGDATRVATAEAEPFWQAWADAANEKLNQVVAVAATPDEPETTVESGPADEPQTTVEEPADQDTAERAPSDNTLATAEAAAMPPESAPAAAATPEPATATANADTGTGADPTANAADGANNGSDAPAPEAEPETVYATFAYDIDNGLPVHEVTYLKYPRLDHGMLYFYSEVDAPDGTTLVHQWRHEGQVVAQQRFNVQGRGARAISYQYIPESARGVWRVYVLDEDGRAIKIGTALY